MKGVFLCNKSAIAAMLDSGGGSIINVASFVAHMGAATPQIAYTSSKGAVLSMTREIAAIYARQGIRANALCPGPVGTEFAEGAGLEEMFDNAPGIAKVSAEEVARQAISGLEKGHRNVVPGLAIRVAVTAGRLTPRALVIRSMLGFVQIWKLPTTVGVAGRLSEHEKGRGPHNVVGAPAFVGDAAGTT